MKSNLNIRWGTNDSGRAAPFTTFICQITYFPPNFAISYQSLQWQCCSASYYRITALPPAVGHCDLQSARQRGTCTGSPPRLAHRSPTNTTRIPGTKVLCRWINNQSILLSFFLFFSDTRQTLCCYGYAGTLPPFANSTPQSARRRVTYTLPLPVPPCQTPPVY